MLKKTELAYAAGLFDGEGTVSICPNRSFKNGSYSLSLRLGMVDKCPVIWLLRSFGGSYFKRVYACHRYRPLYIWAVHSDKLTRFIKLVSPYMKLKKNQCYLALKMQKTFNSKEHKSKKLTQKTRDIRFKIYEKVKSMHSRKGNKLK